MKWLAFAGPISLLGGWAFLIRYLWRLIEPAAQPQDEQ